MDDNIVDEILDELMNDSKDKSNKNLKINKAANDILNLKRKAFTDQEAAKKLDLLCNMVMVKDVEETDFAKLVVHEIDHHVFPTLSFKSE